MKRPGRELFFLSCIIAFSVFLTACGKEEKPLETKRSDPFSLVLDQTEAFVAISANDNDAYNRALPFFFYLETQEDYENLEDLDQWLNTLFDYATLFSSEETEKKKTSTMIWTPSKIEPHKFNLTLAVFPGNDALALDGVQQVTRIVFTNSNGDMVFPLINYYFDQRVTITSPKLSVTSAPIEASLNSELSVTLNYRITPYDDNLEISDFQLEWPKVFSSLDEFVLLETVDSDEGRTFVFSLIFTREADKIVFRPFIKVSFMGEEVFLIPTIPVYINE